MGRHHRQQIETDIGGRGAMGDHAARLLLKVIRRQPVVIGANKLFVEEPSAAGKQAQRLPLFIGRRRRDCHHWPADPIGNFCSQEPDGKKGCTDQERAWIDNADQQHNERHEDDGGRHAQQRRL